MYQVLLTQFIEVLECAYAAYKLHKRMATAKQVVQEIADRITTVDSGTTKDRFPAPILATYTGLLVFYDLEIQTSKIAASQSNFNTFMKDIGTRFETSLIQSMSALPKQYTLDDFLQAWGPAMTTAYKDVANGVRYEQAIANYEKGVEYIPSVHKLAAIYGGLVAKNNSVLNHLKPLYKKKDYEAPDGPMMLIDFVFNSKSLTDSLVNNDTSDMGYSKILRSSSIYNYLTRNGHNPHINPSEVSSLSVRLTALPFARCEARYANVRSSGNKNRAIYRTYDWDAARSKAAKTRADIKKVDEESEDDEDKSQNTMINV